MATDFDFEVKHWVDENPEVQLKMAMDTIKSDRWLHDQYVAALSKLEDGGLEGDLTVPEKLRVIKILIDARTGREKKPCRLRLGQSPFGEAFHGNVGKGFGRISLGVLQKCGKPCSLFEGERSWP